MFDRSTTASDCCDANRGRFDGWAPPTMDELDAFKREVDNGKEALASKLAVILFMECKVSRRLVRQRVDVKASSGFVIGGGQR